MNPRLYSGRLAWLGFVNPRFRLVNTAFRYWLRLCIANAIAPAIPSRFSTNPSRCFSASMSISTRLTRPPRRRREASRFLVAAPLSFAIGPADDQAAVGFGSGRMLKLPGRLVTSAAKPSATPAMINSTAGQENCHAPLGQRRAPMSANCSATSKIETTLFAGLIVQV